MPARFKPLAVLLAATIGLVTATGSVFAEETSGADATSTGSADASPADGLTPPLQGNLSTTEPTTNTDQPQQIADSSTGSPGGSLPPPSSHWWNTRAGQLFLFAVFMALLAAAIAIPVALGVHNANLAHNHRLTKQQQLWTLQYLYTHQHTAPPPNFPSLPVTIVPPVIHHPKPPPPPPPPQGPPP